ncbi:hypothetical protein RJ641_017958 [Dillenia turbinata]|uniref:Uncharacterized protein n=1 Tax=Dillenia turbinata TaxID=194707 RepID=A0AAN8YY45_9MAGN
MIKIKRGLLRRLSKQWRLKFAFSAFRWKRLNIQLSFIDDVLFKIVSVLEAVTLAYRKVHIFVGHT